MAQKILVHLIDDLDGSEASHSVTFGLDGTHYEIDLNDKNNAKLRKALDPYVQKGRRVRAPKRKSSVSGSAIRAWARENGYEVSNRGAIPQEIKDAYSAAH